MEDEVIMEFLVFVPYRGFSFSNDFAEFTAPIELSQFSSPIGVFVF